MERCFTMLKPGVLNRRIAGEIISRLERKGLQLIGMKMLRIDRELAAEHYADHAGKHFYEPLVSYITSGPVVAMAWQGDNCVSIVRRLTGATDPLEAAPGTIRGDYCAHTQHNVMHASDSPENAEREVALFFAEDELFDWKDESAHWY
ncbi:MAG TPA: nucleoside-diphosphate kinase [Candidatus Treponema faecavium]|nr:nucleoside-diphosphate kinase [Candidatus Treponema faecavium]